MATGLLVLVSGTATRLAQFFEKDRKTYIAEIAFGLTSDTYDIEGQVKETGAELPNSEQIHSALENFRGRFFQTPPPVSAKKVGGVPAYKLARQRVAVELKPVEVEVSRLEVQTISADRTVLLVTCSAGTYIRSIAHDLGQQFGCGAVLSALRRTQVGEFTIHQARTLNELVEMAQNGRLIRAVIPSEQLLPQFPAQYFDIGTEAKIRQGRDFRTSPFVVPPGTPFVKALSFSGELIGIGELRMPNLYHPAIVL